MKRLAALVPNAVGRAPGQRVRIESWVPYLEQAGWSVDLYPFEDDELQEVLYEPVSPLTKGRRLGRCYVRQLGRVLRGIDCDVLLIHREAALIGPALIEALAARRHVPIVYDIDDPLFVRYRSPTNDWFSLLKFPSKIKSLCRLSDHVISINSLIASYASRYNASVSVVPNCVDTERWTPSAPPPAGPVRLVWIGSHSTMTNLDGIAAPLRRLQASTRAPLRVIGSGAVALEGVETEARQWSLATELADLASCHIAVVPIIDTPWNHWKTFFKTVQCLAVGLPVVAQRIGGNQEVISDGVNGFLVSSGEQWHDRLLTLVRDDDLRREMGRAGRATVIDRYSTQRQMPRVVDIFDRVLGQSASR